MFRDLSAESVLYRNFSYNEILVEFLPETCKIFYDSFVQHIFDKLAKPPSRVKIIANLTKPYDVKIR